VRLEWFPLKNIIRWTARRHGFLDPITLIARLSSFGQPAEVEQPIELLRAGVILHARGLLNARVIQHNLDWVWPLWVERQFDPNDAAFIPRAFSITHVNLTHRNWTALGLPGCALYPLVDPHGLVTPHYDGWSIDTWVFGKGGVELIPSRTQLCAQSIRFDDGVQVRSETREQGLLLRSEAWATHDGSELAAHLAISVRAPIGSWLVVSVRPYNPEGISLIERIAVEAEGMQLCINDRSIVEFEKLPASIHLSRYALGDVYRVVHQRKIEGLPSGVRGIAGASIDCPVGMASGAAVFPVDADEYTLKIRVPLKETASFDPGSTELGAGSYLTWTEALRGTSTFDLGSPDFNRINSAAVHTLVLLAPGDIYPGPYTYRRFWFRDACFMMHGLLAAGLPAAVERCIDRFAIRQRDDGYLHSQEGEWDSNGLALWAIDHFCLLAHREVKREWVDLITRAADWIVAKRLPSEGESRHRGLLPAGFSAEHLGPNDFYFWDDFWGIGGLESAAALFERSGRPSAAAQYRRGARELRAEVFRAIGDISGELGYRAIPASPYRRLDSGAIGSIVCAYPLRLIPVEDPALLGTVNFLLDHCCVEGAFFQDMIHSGLNPYLTLHLAQVLRRRNDPRAHRMFERVAHLASSTGQWPEAIHPRTGGGCMGDGQHGWAAAEWAAYVRSMFVAEEGDGLLLCSGIPIEWVESHRDLSAVRVLTSFGVVAVTITHEVRAIEIRIDAEWYGEPPPLTVRFLGGALHRIREGEHHLAISWEDLRQERGEAAR
jgi:hypothetical protein